MSGLRFGEFDAVGAGGNLGLAWPRWLAPSTAVLALACVVSLPPIIFIIVNGFNVAGPGEPFTFGFGGWDKAFNSPQTISAIGYSFFLNIRSVIGIVIAFLVAWLLVRVRIPCRGFIELSLWVAFFLPSLPLAISWILLLAPKYGILNHLFSYLGFQLSPYTLYGIIWVHLTATTVPIMTILLAPALRQVEASLEEAARTCGAGPWRSLRYIVIPVLVPAILTVWLAGLIRGLESFQIELLLGRPAGIEVFATRIYDLISWEPPEFSEAITLSNFFLVVLFILALVYQHFTSRRVYATVSGRGSSFREIDIGAMRYVLAAILLTAAVVGIYLPIGTLVLGSCMKLFGFFNIPHPFTLHHWAVVLGDPDFLSALKNSLILGLLSATLAVIVYSFFGYVLARGSIRGKPICSTLLWLPWTVPGILMGLGFLWILLSVPFLSAIYGTIVPLVWVLVVKELPIGVQLLKTSFGQVGEELEQAARVCGAGKIQTLWRVIVPIVSPMILTIFTIVFVGAIRDVDNVILLAGSSTRPLALLMVEYAMGGQMEAASIVSVILALLALTVAVIARRRYGMGA